jgi:tight adherence protein C
MNVLLFIIGIGMFGVSGRLAVRGALVPRLRLKTHLREILDYGFEPVVEEPDLPAMDKLKARFGRRCERTGRFMMRRFPSISSLSVGELSAAGLYDVTPAQVQGGRTLAAIGLPVVALMLLVPAGLSALSLLLVLMLLLAGWMLPTFVIRKRGGVRLEEVDLKLPELIDVLIATVEAGMGFAASLSLVAERFEGALGAELRLTMQQQSLGMSLQAALQEMLQRVDTPSVRAFVRVAARSESQGGSIGPILRELSSDERRRHRMAARTKMQKAPVKMIFPLMFFIFPALMIVLMFPAAYSVMHSLKGVV